MNIEIFEEPVTALDGYARIPMSFVVERVPDVQEDGPCHFLLTERILDRSYIKDYDALDGGEPQRWTERFDVSNWVFLAAHVAGKRVGSAALALNTPGLTMLENRTDLAVLWDIRVSPDIRGRGVGSALFRAAEHRAIKKGCRELKVETQNINVPACRFYARHGCSLRAVDRFAYPELPNEVQMLWYKNLSLGGAG